MPLRISPRCRPEAGHRVVLVQQGDVVEDVFLVLDHALQAALHDDRHFVREGRVVADAVGDGAGQDVAVAVFVLQASPFSVVRPEVPPSRKPRACMSPAAQARSPMRWKPNIE